MYDGYEALVYKPVLLKAMEATARIMTNASRLREL